MQNKRAKWVRTPYLDFSPTIDPDDDIIKTSLLIDKLLIVTVKMDGANVAITNENVAARNGETANHAQFDLLKSMHSQFKWSIPKNTIVYGEWLLAKHSIHYQKELALASFLMVFAVYDLENQLLLSWDDVVIFCKATGLHPVPEISRQLYSTKKSLQLGLSADFNQIVAKGHEGIVVRYADSIPIQKWAQNACKMVRQGHNQSDDWKTRPLIKNEINIEHSYCSS